MMNFLHFTLKLNQETLTWTDVGRMKEKRDWHKASVIDLTDDLISHCQAPTGSPINMQLPKKFVRPL